MKNILAALIIAGSLIMACNSPRQTTGGTGNMGTMSDTTSATGADTTRQ